MRAPRVRSALAACVLLGLSLLVTPWSAAAVVAILVLAWAPFAAGRRRLATALGLSLLVSTLALRFVVAREGAHVTLTPSEKASIEKRAFVTAAVALVEERDLTIAGAIALTSVGLLPESDSENLVATLDASYARMRAAEGETPSPVPLTALGVGSMLAVEPAPPVRDDLAVVFLHGYGGSFTVQCWHAARALQRLHARTVCPSVGFEGAWWTREGDATLRATLAHLRAGGVTRVVLVGLSAGARGAAVLARRHSRSLAGVVLLSGGASARPPHRVPVLTLTGTDDTMFPPRHARLYARAAGAWGTHVRLEGGHFVFLERFDEVERALSTWIEASSLDDATRTHTTRDPQGANDSTVATAAKIGASPPPMTQTRPAAAAIAWPWRGVGTRSISRHAPPGRSSASASSSARSGCSPPTT
jgi:pimeloyl-ACP methyl ester carboxylesterase